MVLGAEATNTILGKDNAYVLSSPLTSTAGSISLDAEDTSQITAKIIAASVSLGLGSGGAAFSIGVSVARNYIGYSVDTSFPYDHLASDNVLTLNPGDRIKIDGGARAGDIFKYLGTKPFTVPFNYTAGTDHPAQVNKGERIKVPAGTAGVAS